jgi:GNAT superfamily N-acetyltransferase
MKRTQAVTIRPYQPADALHLVKDYNQHNPARPLSPPSFRQYLSDAVGAGGGIWVAVSGGRPLAYALASPIPGLDGMAHLEGLVSPQRQRQGIGSYLLAYVCREARQRGWRRLSTPVEALNSAAGCFLQHWGFVFEHEEVTLCRPLLGEVYPISSPGRIVTLPRQAAIVHFCALYHETFGGLPWSQPYSQVEVDSLLTAAGDLLFLAVGEGLHGFAWIQTRERLGIIEPLGVRETLRGQGYGRFLLESALWELQRRGAQQAQIGTWADNHAALNLYQRLGFEYRDSVYYLVLAL